MTYDYRIACSVSSAKFTALNVYTIKLNSRQLTFNGSHTKFGLELLGFGCDNVTNSL